MKRSISPGLVSLIAASAAALLSSQYAFAAGPYYWDNNGASSGFGTASGTWTVPTTGDSTQGWSTDATGGTLPGSITTATTDAVNFGNGATGLGAGTITVSGAVDSGNITFASGSGAIVLSGGIINLAATTTISVNNTTDTISSKLTGAGTSLVKSGAGTLTLSGDNTFSGGLNFQAGALNINSNTALGTGGVLAINSGGTLDNTSGGTVTIANNITSSVNTTFGGSYALTTTGSYTYNNSNRVLLVNGSAAFTVGTFANVGGEKLRKRGSGTLAITGAWTSGSGIEFEGNQNAGTVLIGNKGSLGTGTLVVFGGGSGILKASTTLTGTDKITNAVNLGGGLTLGGSSDFELGGIISSTGTLSKSDANTVILSGANTYTGATTVNAGTLKAGIASVANTSGAFGNNSAVTMANFAGATLDITGFNTQIGSLTGGGASGGNITLGSATLTVGGNNTSPAAYAGVISGTNGVLTKIGSGTLTLSGSNNYSGGTNINAGILQANHASALGSTGNITFGGGTLQYTAASSGQNFGARIKSSSAIKLDFNGQGATLTGIDNTNTSGLLLSNTGAHNTLNFSATNSHSGGTTVGDKIRVNLTNATGLGSGLVTISSGGQVYFNSIGMSVANNFSLNGAGWTGESPTLGALRMSNNTSIGSGSTVTLASTSTIHVDNTRSATINGKITGVGGLTVNSSGVGTLVLTNSSNDYTGATTINTGTLKVGASGAIPTGSGKGNVTFNSAANTATFDINGFDTTVNGLSQAVASTTNKVVNNTSSTSKTLTVGNADTTSSFAGIIADNTGVGGTLALSKIGTGSLTLSGANTYTGATTIKAGTLKLDGSGSIASTSIVVGDAGSSSAVLDVSTKSGGFDVPSGTTLSGIGTVNGATSITGIVAPGNSGIGTLTVGSANLTWKGVTTPGATTNWKFDLPSSGTVSDKLVINGDFLRDATAGTNFYFDFTGSTPAYNTTYTLVTWTGTNGFAGFLSNFKFGGLSPSYNANSQFTFNGSSLQFTAIPELSNILIGGLLGTGLLRRRRACEG